MFRKRAAVLNYLVQDLADVGYSAKALAQGMSCPCFEDLMNLKNTLRYHRSFPRCITLYNVRISNPSVMLETDRDWAGDASTRKDIGRSDHVGVTLACTLEQDTASDCFVFCGSGGERMCAWSLGVHWGIGALA